ncbi:MAG: DUF1376 domain-containing protein [Alphaproteobacteria bacterium]
MAGMSWFRLYPRDWLTGTRTLSVEARAVYFDIIALIYEHGGPVAYDEQELSRMLRVQVRRLRRVLDELTRRGKLTIENGTISNARAGREIVAAEVRAQRASEGGAARAAAARKPRPKRESDRNNMRENLAFEGGGIEQNQPLDQCQAGPETQNPPVVPQADQTPQALYVYQGDVVRLTPDDFARWRETFSAIPDLVAELRSIDRWCVAHWPTGSTKRKRWFKAVAGMLDKSNREHLNRRRAEPEPPSTSAEYFRELDEGTIH